MRIIAGSFFALMSIFPSAWAFGQATAAAPPDQSIEEKPVQIVLHPAPEPRPALKYQLLPPLMERRPGNAAVWWNRIPAEKQSFFSAFQKEYDPSGRIGKWLDMPLGDPREKAYRENELKETLHLLGTSFAYCDMERAASFESCDWQMPIREGNYCNVLLPEVQQTRTFARMLVTKARLEIAEGKYDRAVRTLQVGFAEARHVAQGQTMVNMMVGAMIAEMMCHEVQVMLQQPDAPNLYWALGALPWPLVDVRIGSEVEANILCLQFPELYDLDRKKLSPDGWQALLEKVSAGSDELRKLFANDMKPKDRDKPAPSAKEVYPRAKQYLIERGRAAAEVEAMPMAQVVLLYSVSVFNEHSDDLWKWFFLPAHEVEAWLESAKDEKDSNEDVDFGILPPFSAWSPAAAAHTPKSAETRCQSRVAVLRIFEALRLHAANHQGRWPDRLSDITEVPIPLNPYDGKPFSYERHGDTAVLSAEKGPKNWPRRYELKLISKAE